MSEWNPHFLFCKERRQMLHKRWTRRILIWHSAPSWALISETDQPSYPFPTVRLRQAVSYSYKLCFISTWNTNHTISFFLSSEALRAMEKSEESMVEEREGMIFSPSGGKPFLKKSYFLKPTLLNSSIDEPPCNLPPSFSSLPSRFKPDTYALKVDFPGWPQQNKSNWKSWVHEMASVHQSTWKKAGIYEAIFSST